MPKHDHNWSFLLDHIWYHNKVWINIRETEIFKWKKWTKQTMLWQSVGLFGHPFLQNPFYHCKSKSERISKSGVKVSFILTCLCLMCVKKETKLWEYLLTSPWDFLYVEPPQRLKKSICGAQDWSQATIGWFQSSKSYLFYNSFPFNTNSVTKRNFHVAIDNCVWYLSSVLMRATFWL